MLQFPPALSEALSTRGERLTVLILRLGALGDIVRTVPAVRLIRRALPGARIHWVLEDKWRVALEGHADLDGIVVVPRREWDGRIRRPWSWPSLVGSVSALRTELRALGAGLVVDFHGNLRSGLIGRMTGAEVRLGYDGHQQKEGNRRFTSHRVPAGHRRTPRMERNLDLVRALGLPDSPLPPAELPLVQAGRDPAAAVLRELACATPYAVLSPGASAAQAAKKPPAELLAEACAVLEERAILPLVVWGPGEEPDARAVVERSTGTACFAPPTNLSTLMALLADARVFLGGDSGPMHMACAAGCPVVAIYGPTDPLVNQPWGVPYRTVHSPDREYTGIKRIDRTLGFEGLSALAIREALESLLDQTATRSHGG